MKWNEFETLNGQISGFLRFAASVWLTDQASMIVEESPKYIAMVDSVRTEGGRKYLKRVRWSVQIIAKSQFGHDLDTQLRFEREMEQLLGI